MAFKYRVSPEQSPGVYRAGVGFFGPGDVLTLPDAASVKGEVYSAKLIPLDEDSFDELMCMHKNRTVGGMPVTIHEVEAGPPAPPVPQKGQTIKEVATHGPGGQAPKTGGGHQGPRAADK